MPELPEVETTRRGIEPHLRGQTVSEIFIRDKRLRWPIPSRIKPAVVGNKIISIERRAKYLLMKTTSGTVILHLGMSGHLRIAKADEPYKKHDHFILNCGKCSLRLHDPRRFGAVLYTSKDPLQHALLSHLGPEPLSDNFTAKHLYDLSRKRQVAVKQFIMDNKVVVGVGNIYATEALFHAGIHPKRAAKTVSMARYERLFEQIQRILTLAIEQGGSTLRDFLNSEGTPGYFAQNLYAYGRDTQACRVCHTTIKTIRLGQRSSCYCPKCQR